MVFEMDDDEEDAEKLDAFEVVDVVDADKDSGKVCCTDEARFLRVVGDDDDERPVVLALPLIVFPTIIS